MGRYSAREEEAKDDRLPINKRLPTNDADVLLALEKMRYGVGKYRIPMGEFFDDLEEFANKLYAVACRDMMEVITGEKSGRTAALNELRHSARLELVDEIIAFCQPKDHPTHTMEPK